jgi:acyl-CoA thioester hydrolase
MPHEFSLRVYYEDTDAGGIVYYANYLKFVERARTEALIGLGLSQIDLRRDRGILFVVKSASIDYRAPARLEDQLLVVTHVMQIGASRIDMAQDVTRTGQLLAACRITLVCVGPEGRAHRMPDDVRATLATLAG